MTQPVSKCTRCGVLGCAVYVLMVAFPNRPLLSASQAKRFIRCQRRWGWEYLDKIRHPPGPGAARGSRIHGMLDRHFTDGLDYLHHVPTKDPPDPDEAKVARAIGDSWREYIVGCNGKVTAVEDHVGFVTKHAVWHGFRDLTVWNGAQGVLVVGDHKTTSDFRWMIPAADLGRDHQAVIYAEAAFRAWEDHVMQDDHLAEFTLPDHATVRVRWVYGRTRGSAAVRVSEAEIRRDYARGHIQELDETVAKPISQFLRAHEAGQLKPMDLDPNRDACRDYGGCPHRDRCTDLNPVDDLVSRIRFGRLRMDLKARLRQQIEQKSGQGDIDPATPPPGPFTGVNPAPKPARPDRIPLAGASSKPKVDPAVRTLQQFAQSGPTMTTKSKQAKPTSGAQPEQSGSTTTAEPSKPEPGQFHHVEIKPEHASTGGPTTPEAVDSRIKQIGGYTLCVNCMPVGHDVIRASDLIETAHAAVRQEVGVVDYRVIEFGRGPGVLAACLERVIGATNLNGWTVVLDARTSEGGHTLQTFERFAAQVYRGF